MYRSPLPTHTYNMYKGRRTFCHVHAEQKRVRPHSPVICQILCLSDAACFPGRKKSISQRGGGEREAISHRSECNLEVLIGPSHHDNFACRSQCQLQLPRAGEHKRAGSSVPPQYTSRQHLLARNRMINHQPPAQNGFAPPDEEHFVVGNGQMLAMPTMEKFDSHSADETFPLTRCGLPQIFLWACAR